MDEADPRCATPGCGKPPGHRGRHANQGSVKAPAKAPAKVRTVTRKPSPPMPPPAAVNGQLVRVTLTVPLADLLQIATVESASL